MVKLVHKAHPWTKEFNFLEVYCAKYGICAFPRYVECPFYEYTIHGDRLLTVKEAIREAFRKKRHEANPTATKEAMTEG